MNTKISVVSPFYNEQNILEKAIARMKSNLELLNHNWELILVNDGSIDDSFAVASEIAKQDPRIKIVSYEKNQGRGYALKQGIDNSTGEFIITTEVDCSWGDDIVAKLFNALLQDKSLDVVVASTKLAGGGYNNVPWNRVFLSKAANYFLRIAISNQISMYTGMTRGYRSNAIKALPISEKGKEFHLDVLAKANAFGLKIGEIPAIITWQDDKLARANAPKRKSSSKIPKLIFSHLLFGITGRPYRYLLASSFFSALLAMFFMSWGVINFVTGTVSIFLLTLAFLSLILAVLLGGIGVLSMQQSIILREQWITRKEVTELKNLRASN